MKPLPDTETAGNGGFYFFLLSWMLSHFRLHHFGSPLSTEPVNSTLWSPNAASEAFWRQRGAEQRGRHCELKTKSIDSAGLKYGINHCGIYCELCEAYNLLLGLVCVC